MNALSPEWVRELAREAAARGVAFLNAPVGGSKGAAAAGQLVFFVGGSAETLAAARPALEAVSGQIHHLGGTGAGATWKLINNVMVAVQIAAAAEGLALAEKAGFDRAQAAAVIAGSGTASPLVKMKMPRMAELDFASADFALRHMAKELRYAKALASDLGTTASLAEAAAGYYKRAEASGHADQDFAVVLKALRE